MLNQQETYKKSVKSYHPKISYVSNALRAFISGGIICVLGQALQNVYIHFFHFSFEEAGNPTVATLIFIASLLTGLGVYDKIGALGLAGTLIPVTGFANAVTSAALEHKSEGIILGIAANLFKLAGAVIVFGVVASAVLGIIRLLFEAILK